MSTLWQISDEMHTVEKALDEMELGEEEKGAAIDAYLSDNSELSAKLDNYAALIREYDARSKARKEEAQRMSELSRFDDNAAAGLKERLKLFFETHDLPKQQTARFNIAIQANGGAIPVRYEGDPSDLPLELQRVITSANMDALRKALQAGNVIPGATLGVRGTHISIR